MIAKKLGFSNDQLRQSLTVDLIGNPYSGSSLIGLARVLDYAKPSQTILVTSYGSGAGSDSFSLVTNNRIRQMQKIGRTCDDYIKRKNYISYTKYMRMRRKILL